MHNHIHFLRPVGNSITTRKVKTSEAFFSPFDSSFFSSGTASLAAAIIASRKLKPDIKQPEVIVPAYGCPDLISAIIYAGALPVLADLEENSPLMSLEQLNTVINNNTIAIVAVRFFGIAERNEKLLEITRKHDIILIEDSAQGFPTSDSKSYWSGDFIILSFGRGKPVNLLGGGAVLSRKPELMKLLPSPSPAQNKLTNDIKYKLKLFLYNQSIRPLAYGIITRIPGLRIGQTIYKPLDTLASIHQHTTSLLSSNLEAYKIRTNYQQEYNRIFQAINNDILINLPEELTHDMSQPLLRYPILIQDYLIRDQLYEKLKPYGVSLMYKKPLHQIDNVGKHIVKQKEYPNASQFARQLLTLPTHEAVNNDTLQIIERVIRDI